MSDERVEKLFARHEKMVNLRSLFNTHWQEVSYRVFPENDTFLATHTQGARKSQRVFDSTPIRALNRFAAAMVSMLIPPTQKWHGLTLSDESIADVPEVKRWLERSRDLLFAVRMQPQSRFQHNVFQALMQVGAFGNGPMYVEDKPGEAILYIAVDLAKVWWLEDYCGNIDTVDREITWTARQVKQQFGEDNLPQQLKAAVATRPDREFTIIHAVGPNEDIVQGARDASGKPIASHYLCKDTREIITTGGFNTTPWAIGRYMQTAGELYGRGPGMEALADIKTLNEMSKTNLRAGQRIVDPPMLLTEDGMLQPFSLRPGAMNYGGLSDQGEELVKPLVTGAELPISLEMENQRRASIDDSFLVTLFKIIVNNPGMTATAVLELAQEKGELLGPSGGRLQSDLLGPIIARELDILERGGILPPRPQAMLGHEVRVMYQSPLNKAMRAGEAVGFQRFMQAIAPMAQVDPTIMDIIDPEESSRDQADVLGVPAKYLRTPDQVAAIKGQRAQAAQAQQLLAAAPVAAAVAKDTAQAAATAANVPAPQVLPSS